MQMMTIVKVFGGGASNNGAVLYTPRAEMRVGQSYRVPGSRFA